LDEGVERVKVFAFIDAQKTVFDVKTLCRVCSVSRSAFYDWAAAVAAGPDQALWDEAIVADAIFDIWKRSRGRYGAPRITAEMCRRGSCVNHKRVERLMAELGIAGKCGRRKMRTTIRDPREKPAVDLVKRIFGRDRPDQLWVGDLTYIPTDEGWLYVASVLDACSRRLLGWSIADHMRTEICTDALRAAVATRGRARLDGVVFHSDHGCQYTSNDYKTICADLHIVQSMGTVGDSYDNAMAESFWASLKRELVDDAHYATKEEARVAVFEWLVWYNRERLHSSIGYQPPEEYEDRLLSSQAA
jgi:transposase InsO family protein